MTFESPITDVKGIGETVAKKFAVLGITSVGDLVLHYPRRYDDYSQITPITQLRPGMVTVEAVIKQAIGRYVRRGMHITEAVASDQTGSVRLVWFNQPYRANSLKSGQQYFIAGQYELRRQRFTIMNPAVEAASEFPVNTARIIGVYRETRGLTSKQIRQAVKAVLPVIRAQNESLPKVVVQQNKLMSRAEALEAIHFPKSSDDLERAKRRLGFEEVFQLTLASLLNKRENQHETAITIPFDERLARDFVKHLPFTLTDDQRKAIWQIYLDMQKTQPMNRLIEGDVGSGKTVVAAMAAVMALAQDFQVAFMAPTELLARQHYETLAKLLKPLGWQKTLQLLVGSMTAAEKKSAHAAIANKKARFIVGTHALIQEKVDMHTLALVIIDEQHRFGVDQRKALMAKAGHMPHVLSLTATPIPRSLALTLFGELDITILAEKPAGRLPIVTQIVSPNSRKQLYDAVNAQLDHGHQMYVVCPLISESEVLEAASAEKIYEQFKKIDFKNRRVGLLHGRLKPPDKQAVMEEFLAHKLDILVATTVIEVGVDVPNANIMLIESAERFGLAQLHQLRGRVGRGSAQAYCYLMLSDSQPASRRLRAMESSNDGFKLAELDLEIRGPGAIYGVEQHGALDLRVAKLTDTHLIASARSSAQELLESGENLLNYKELMKRVNRLRVVTNLN